MDLAKLRDRKLKELQAQYEQARDEEKILGEIKRLEEAVRPYLTREAYERYARVRIAHPKNAIEALAQAGHLIETGRKRMFNDEDFKEILRKLQTNHKVRIKRG